MSRPSSSRKRNGVTEDKEEEKEEQGHGHGVGQVHETTGMPPRRRRGIAPQACMQCRSIKIKCSAFPCARCLRLSLPCRPQVTTTSPLTELVLDRYDPRPLVDTYLAAFRQVQLEDGGVDRTKCLRMLRLWRVYSQCMGGVDLSMGIAKIIQKECQISLLDLEAEGGLSMGLSKVPTAHQRLLQEEANNLVRAAQQLKQTSAFRLVDDGRTPLIMFEIDGQHMKQTNNLPYDSFFRSTTQMFSDMIKKRALQGILFAAGCAHDDREAFFRLQIRSFFGKGSTKRTEFLKIFTEHGDCKLYIVHCRTMEVLDGEEGAHRVLISFDPAPPSRHVSETPRSMNIIKTFRRRPQEQHTSTDNSRPMATNSSSSGSCSISCGSSSSSSGSSNSSSTTGIVAASSTSTPFVPPIASMPLPLKGDPSSAKMILDQAAVEMDGRNVPAIFARRRPLQVFEEDLVAGAANITFPSAPQQERKNAKKQCGRRGRADKAKKKAVSTTTAVAAAAATAAKATKATAKAAATAAASPGGQGALRAKPRKRASKAAGTNRGVSDDGIVSSSSSSSSSISIVGDEKNEEEENGQEEEGQVEAQHAGAAEYGDEQLDLELDLLLRVDVAQDDTMLLSPLMNCDNGRGWAMPFTVDSVEVDQAFANNFV